MNKSALLITLALLTSTAFAERFQDTVHSVSRGQNQEKHLVFMENGRVLHVSPEDESIDDYKPGESIDVEVDENNEVKSVSSIADLKRDFSEEKFLEEDAVNATVLPSYAAATSLFAGMNRSWKSNTECTDRAHIWSYEEWRKSGHVSRKVFLFFTNTYIRRYNFHWWFHVSPYTFVGSTEYVMDRRYNSGPRTMKNWTDTFIRSKRSCPVTTYRNYRNNRNGSEHCYAVKSNMYNRLPLHVRNEEDSGRVQTRFNTSEVNFSYRAFTRRGVR